MSKSKAFWMRNDYILVTLFVVIIVSLLFMYFIINEETTKDSDKLIPIIVGFVSVLAFIYKLVKPLERQSYSKRKLAVKIVDEANPKSFERKFNATFQKLEKENYELKEIKEIDKFTVYIYYYPKG